MESGLGDPEASPLSVPAARHLAACVSIHTGEASFPLDHFGYSGRAVEYAAFRLNTHYRLPLPLEYIFPLPARVPRRVGPSLRSNASLAASETIGDDFFEGLEEVAGTQASNRASTPASDLRKGLRQNRTNLLTLRAFPPAPGAASVDPPHSFSPSSRPGYLPRNLF